MRSVRFLVLCALAVITPFAAQAVTSVPEIDPGSAVTALTLLSGSVFVFAGRKSKK